MNYQGIIIVALLVFVLNIPFGYWRATVKKFSFQWFAAIHIPIPFIVFMRFKFHIGFVWYSYPIFIAAFFLGQRLGAHIAKRNGASYYLKKKSSNS